MIDKDNHLKVNADLLLPLYLQVRYFNDPVLRWSLVDILLGIIFPISAPKEDFHNGH